MGFCTDDEYEHFLRLAPAVEREVINNGIILSKYSWTSARRSSAGGSKPVSATR